MKPDDARPMNCRSAEPLPPGAKFPLGRVVVTPNAASWLPAEVIARALKRHQSGDWGDVAPCTARENDEALTRGGPFFSTYFKRGPDFSICTAGNPRRTIVQMPWDWNVPIPPDDEPPPVPSP